MGKYFGSLYRSCPGRVPVLPRSVSQGVRIVLVGVPYAKFSSFGPQLKYLEYTIRYYLP